MNSKGAHLSTMDGQGGGKIVIAMVRHNLEKGRRRESHEPKKKGGYNHCPSLKYIAHPEFIDEGS